MQRFPLSWPEGWPRARGRKPAQFGTSRQNALGDRQKKRLTIADGMERVIEELEALGVNARDDALISTNLKLNLSGLPRGDQGEPSDPGVAVYWQKKNQPMRVMAIDVYYRVADNLAAIAATLAAMRAIERHGGAQILERAFTGFDALPAPQAKVTRPWWEVLGLRPDASADIIEQAYRAAAKRAHPDTGGSHAAMAELNAARDAALKARAA